MFILYQSYISTYFVALILMYPFLDVLWTQIHMTWLWIIIFVVVFLRWIRSYGKQLWVETKAFLKFVPLYIIFIYLFGTYFRYLIGQWIFFPTTLQQIMRYISPYDYSFHLVWIMVWIRISLRHFFSTMRDKNKQTKRIDIFFLSTMVAMIPFWIFLLLWDSFIWSPTESGFHISALQPESKVATYDAVIPLGLYVSLSALILYVLTKIIRVKFTNLRWFWLYWSILFIFLFSIILLFQEYPRHVVIWFLWKTWDIKNYALFFVCWILIREYKKTYSFFSNVDAHIKRFLSAPGQKNSTWK